MEALTPRQAETMAHIRESIATRGYPPTIRELANLMGMKSTNGPAENIERLVAKGHLRRDATKARGFVPVDSGTVNLARARQVACLIADEVPLSEKGRTLAKSLLAALGIGAA